MNPKPLAKLSSCSAAGCPPHGASPARLEPKWSRSQNHHLWNCAGARGKAKKASSTVGC